MAEKDPRVDREGIPADLVAAIEFPNGARVEGRIGKAEYTVVGIDFPADTKLVLPLGRGVELHFRTNRLPEPVRATGKIVFRREMTSTVRYEFQFGLRDAELLSAVLHRRAAARVRPADPIGVQVRAAGTAEGEAVNGLLNDLSLTGAAITVSSQSELTLCRTDRLALEFRLPTSSQPLSLIGVVRYRRMANTMVRYGLEFDRAASGEWDVQAKALMGYLGRPRSETGPAGIAHVA